MPPWAQILLALFGGSGVVSTVWSIRRTHAQDAGDLFDEVPKIRARAIAAEERCEELDREVKKLREQVLRVPVALMAGRLEDLNGLAKWFDGFTEPIVASSSEQGGSLIYVNPAFCAALSRDKAELLGLAWRALLHPVDARRTRAVEAAAHYEPARNFGNRFLHGDGRYRPLVWNCDVYTRGLTLCRVEVMEES